MLDRLRVGIEDAVNKQGPTFRAIFTTLLQYKIAWMRWGVSCPILDLVVFRKIRQSVGGRVQLMLVGGGSYFVASVFH